MKSLKQIFVLLLIFPGWFCSSFSVTVERERVDLLQVNDITCQELNGRWRDRKCFCPRNSRTFHLVDNNYGCFTKEEIVEDCNDTRGTTLLEKKGKDWKSVPTDVMRLSVNTRYQCKNSFIWINNLELKRLAVSIKYEIISKSQVRFSISQIKPNNDSYKTCFNEIKGSVIKLVSSCNRVDICVLLKAEGEHTYNIPPKTSTTPTGTLSPKQTSSKPKATSEKTTLGGITSIRTTSEKTTTEGKTSERTSSSRITPRGVLTNSLEANETSKTETNMIIGVVCSIVIILILIITFILIRLKHKREKKPPTAAMYATYEDVNPSANTAYANHDSEYAYCKDVSIRNQASALDEAKENENTYKCLESEKNLDGEYAQLSLPETAVTGLSDPENEPVYLETEPEYATTEPECFEAQPIYVETETEYGTTEQECFEAQPIYVETEPEYATTEAQYETVLKS